jgi:hypothetical protein
MDFEAYPHVTDVPGNRDDILMGEIRISGS